MRILVAALGSPGHAFPLVPLAVALQEAGHDVTVSVGAGFESTIATSGVPTIATGLSLNDGFAQAVGALGLTERPQDPEIVHGLAMEVFGGILPRASLAGHLPWIEEHRPDLVVAEIADAGAALAARAHGVPCVMHAFGRRLPPQAPMTAVVGEPLVAVAAEVGVSVAAGDLLAHAYLDICPPSLQEPEADRYLVGMAELPLRPVGWNPPTPFTPRHRGGRPWVLLTLGTAFGEAGVLRAAAEGLAGADVDVLVATGSVEAGELADVRADGVQVEPFVPQADLLAGRVEGVEPPAVVVHHGGSGTTFACSAAGIPQLFLPQGADQFYNAGAVSGIGAGRQLIGPEATPAVVGKAVRELLDDGPERAAARALASEVAALPAPADVAAQVAAWAQPAM